MFADLSLLMKASMSHGSVNSEEINSGTAAPGKATLL